MDEKEIVELYGPGEMEKRIAVLLRAGVVTAAGIVLLGGVVLMTMHATEILSFHEFNSEPDKLRTLPGIIGYAFHGRGRGIIQLGILCLIATPIMRVAFSLFAFARQKDRVYVAVTLIVLAVLIYSLVFGL